ncbi:hypothetical protein GLAREA_05655 [Glarea lozoyensis ATCC 20868]|uniref:Uncharacterized protein n=1 Tax=Glarea lozoyensis (strain ATCC 20868 / MF5171) TaxID=1116229 RepID=S3DD62_GLAL2|nr:uncharacterized protein GLAREA_05655 [Glarea lozoyensis ATCC 20868]EPE36317.1 hypothetical protein GLAREA_05655 [Glarea lozoyensis ATCC 20868]
MSKRVLRPTIGVCHLCQSMLTRKSSPAISIRATKSANATRFFSSRHPKYQNTQKESIIPSVRRKQSTSKDVEQTLPAVKHRKTLPEIKQTFTELKSISNAILEDLERIPSEKEIESFYFRCIELAKALQAGIKPEQTDNKERKDRATSALLDLEDDEGVPSISNQTPDLIRMEDELSKLAYSIAAHPPIPLTANILAAYVKIQHTLKKPSTLADVFHLYATKPIPKEGTTPITYSVQNPDKSSNAVPQPIADKALEAAIEKRDLVAAMDIIEFSYATKAYRRAKFIKTGLLPVTGFAAAPFAAYVLASRLAHWQTTMEPELATNVAFAGMVAYIGFTGSIGVVALTTANDQMDRVTWAPGMPLRERWVREDERAAIDKISGAWGFRELWRRGEEEGEEWEAIREWAGLKGMILDRTELMEGME